MSLLICAPSFANCLIIGSPSLRRTTPALRVRHPRLSLRISCSTPSQAPLRRSANYQPNIWSHDYIQSLTTTTNYAQEADEDNVGRIKKLEEEVRKLIDEAELLEDQLQLIDHLQQLGVAYHFKYDIEDILCRIHGSLEDIIMQLRDNLSATSLLFRLLRESGFDVSEGIFNGFKDEKAGCFKSCLQDQTKGLLSLYEASYLAKEGEVLLDEARDFTTEHLKRQLAEGSLEPHLREHVAHALELPLNWRMPRVHTRWFIEACSQNEASMNPILLELAKRNFNVVQSIHRAELRQNSSWWTNLGLAEKLPFFRDRLTENYLWAVGFAFEPEFSSFREIQTKVFCFTTLIDDVYDVHGTLDELQLFTDVVERWDVNAIDQLPEYMQLCFLSLFNMVNEEGYKITRNKGLDVIPYLKRAWADLCKAYLTEAKWYHQGYWPKLEEYLDNASVSISTPLMMTHAYCISKDLTKETLECFSNYKDFTRWSAMLLRLYDDLGTSTKELERGDVPKSIQCCMHERDVSEEVARQHIRELVMANWRSINGDRAFDSSLDEYFKSAAINIARTAQFIYLNGDGYGVADGETKNQVISVLLQPIKI